MVLSDARGEAGGCMSGFLFPHVINWMMWEELWKLRELESDETLQLFLRISTL
ncbi:hypothetical protein DPMN_030149 [Dreissena polymorpha]|uniref:Uncharacterized protein n=1 Tax=Dreissena polymorpha TaxID=45954 RepID=A0A9D4M0C2_DREPO|nr:hypothetical protein DPMN_030149 [Dreissena polymorpha]